MILMRPKRYPSDAAGGEAAEGAAGTIEAGTIELMQGYHKYEDLTLCAYLSADPEGP